MLIDLLNSSNYIMVNMDAIRIFGLNAAVYCSEVLNIYKKAVKKNQFYVDGTYFKLDRNYIEKQTSINVEEQLKCDKNLLKVNVIKISAENPDIINFNVETYASILSSQDVKLLENVSKKVKVENPKGIKATKEERIIIALKDSIECKTPQVLYALRDWIDAITATKPLSKIQVKLFKDKIDDYCNGDLPKALEIIKLATVHQYIDCQWAINLYERNNKPNYRQPINTQVRVTEQTVTKEEDLGEELY